MMFLYSISVSLYSFAVSVASLFNQKAKLWVSGRRNWRRRFAEVFPADKRPVVWFHCASLGEYEQGLPLMERIKKEYPHYFLLLTFFSPSGYEIRKKTPIADYVAYLPSDTKKNASDFIRIAKPAMAFFIKYEFWFHYLDTLQRQDVPVYFVSALFRPSQYFFKGIGRWARKYLERVSMFFVQNEQSKELLHSIGIRHVVVSGDTRFDRTLALAVNPAPVPLVETFRLSASLLVGGSTWPPEEAILHSIAEKEIPETKIVIAPHDVSEEHIKAIEKQFQGKCIRYSAATPENVRQYNVLIIDCIGLLGKIYQYADAALIGGAFGRGLHNILEALTYGVPVFFGPETKKFPEAQQAIEAGCGFKVNNQENAVSKITTTLQDKQCLLQLAATSKAFVKSHTGATEAVFEQLRFQ